MRNEILSLLISFALACLMTGCGTTRVVYVPAGEPMRLADSVKSRVWVKDDSGKLVRSNNKVTIPEGWYTLPK
jgi:hypothetical protein